MTSNDGTTRVLAVVRAKPGDESEVLAALVANAASSLTEPGCLSYAVHRSTTDPATFVLIEAYDSPESFANHERTPHIQRLREVLSGTVAESPLVHVLGAPENLVATAEQAGDAS